MENDNSSMVFCVQDDVVLLIDESDVATILYAIQTTKDIDYVKLYWHSNLSPEYREISPGTVHPNHDFLKIYGKLPMENSSW